jgi:thiamine biosynthesis lipoprotein
MEGRMRRQRILFGTVLALLICLAGTHPIGCARQPRFEFTRLCMGVQTRITVHALDADDAAAAVVPAFARIERAEQALSDYRPASDAMRLCDLADTHPGEWLSIQGDLRAALEDSCRVAAATDGAFSPTIGSAVRLWRQSRQSGTLPAESDRVAAIQRSDRRNLELKDSGTNIRLAPGTRLDFGGIGKGYAAQAAIDDLRKRGFPSSMVALGGDIVVGDAPPGRAGWRIRVIPGDPDGSGGGGGDGGSERTDLLLSNAAVSTSGDSEQFIEIDGAKYSHIVNPRTGLGFPAPRGVRVTVVARSGAIADALGTALYALPQDRAPQLLAHFHAAAIFVIDRPDAAPEVRIIDPHNMIRWAE